MTSDNSFMESVSHEHRKFAPPSDFVDAAHISGDLAYRALYKKSVQDPEAFWAEAAGKLHWFTTTHRNQNNWTIRFSSKRFLAQGSVVHFTVKANK